MDSILSRLQAVFPIQAGAMELTLESVEPGAGGLRGIVRMILWEEERSVVCSVKEQQLWLLSSEQAADPRVAEAIEGWAAALEAAGEDAPERWSVLMPSDLWRVPQLLKLKRPQTAHQFTDAMLRRLARSGG